MQRQFEKREKTSILSDDSSSRIDNQLEIDDGVSTIVDDDSGQEDSASSADGFLSELDGLYAETKKTGPKIDEILSKLVNRAIDRSMPDKQYRELEERYLVPENCPRLEVPAVNRELWTALKDKRESDIALQSVQKFLKHAMVPTLQALGIIKSKGDQSKFPQLFKDIFKILANGIYHCNKKRKSLIRPAVPLKYRKVCDIEAPITSNLFGDDLDSKVDEIEKEERRSEKFSSKADHFLSQKPAQKGRSTQWSGRSTELKYQKLRYQMKGKSSGKSSRYGGKPQSGQAKGKRLY